MIYATLADMVLEFGERELVELTDDDAVGVVNEARVASVLATANSMVDASIAARHQLPLAEVPPFIRMIALHIARHGLYRSTPPEGVVKNYDSALSQLRQVAKGTLRLDQGAEVEAARPGAVLVTDPGRVFSREKLKGF